MYRALHQRSVTEGLFFRREQAPALRQIQIILPYPDIRYLEIKFKLLRRTTIVNTCTEHNMVRLFHGHPAKL